MLEFGLHTALDEITLVLFTTLAPSGVMAFILLSFLLLKQPEWLDRKRVQRMLCVPLIIATVGLIASATHLGNPANALYVFFGVGRSPLSNEVFFAVVFLFLAGIYWLYSFSLKPHLALQKVWLGAIMLAGIAFITSIAFAYSVPTITTWNTFLVPVGLWIDAFVGGPLVALYTLQLARSISPHSRSVKILLSVSLVAILAKAVVLILQDITLLTIENAVVTAKELVPYSTIAIIVFVLLAITGLAIYWRNLRKGKLATTAQGALSCALVYLGLFSTRFVFYAMHMTVGVGV